MAKTDASKTRGNDPVGGWLLLIHQLPAKPAYVRVKLWRRLQAIGAISVKGAVHALPDGLDAREDFAWLARQIVDGGGEAAICEAKFIAGLSDADVKAMFNAARDEDYQSLAKEARELAKECQRQGAGKPGLEIGTRLARLRSRFDQVAAIDFFGAAGREGASGILNGVEAALSKPKSGPTNERKPSKRATANGGTWVTRHGVHVDRIASAWLIRRFVDVKAKFKFVPASGYKAKPGELRFDMMAGEFTHRGEQCTFEVLLGEFGLSEPALAAIGEIVHDIDLKDGKYARAQTEGIKTVIAGICISSEDDGERLKRGGAIFDDLYEFFRKSKGR